MGFPSTRTQRRKSKPSTDMRAWFSSSPLILVELLLYESRRHLDIGNGNWQRGASKTTRPLSIYLSICGRLWWFNELCKSITLLSRFGLRLPCYYYCCCYCRLQWGHPSSQVIAATNRKVKNYLSLSLFLKNYLWSKLKLFELRFISKCMWFIFFCCILYHLRCMITMSNSAWLKIELIPDDPPVPKMTSYYDVRPLPESRRNSLIILDSKTDSNNTAVIQ